MPPLANAIADINQAARVSKAIMTVARLGTAGYHSLRWLTKSHPLMDYNGGGRASRSPYRITGPRNLRTTGFQGRGMPRYRRRTVRRPAYRRRYRRPYRRRRTTYRRRRRY